MGLFLGRILGIVRELTLAGHLGASSTADIAIALITLPDIIINIFIGNATAAVFIPKIQRKSNDVKFRYFLKLSSTFLISFSLLSLLLFLNIDLLANAILPAQQSSDIFVSQLKWTLFAIPFLALNSVSRLFLQNENKFGLIGLENVIFNVLIIFAIQFIAGPESMHYVTAAVISGSVLRWLVQALQIFKIYRQQNPLSSNDHLSLQRNDFYRFTQALSTGLIIQVIPIFARSMSSYFSGAGGLSIFNYVYKFTEFPLALGSSIIAAVVFPKLSKLYVENKDDYLRLNRKTHELILLATLPLCIIGPTLIIKTLPYFNQLKILDHLQIPTLAIACALTIAFLGIRALNEYYIVLMNSQNDVKTPLKSSFIAAPFGFVAIVSFSSSHGVIGAFLGLNIFYTLVLGFNIYFMQKYLDIKFKDLYFNKRNVFTVIGAFIFSALVYILF